MKPFQNFDEPLAHSYSSVGPLQAYRSSLFTYRPQPDQSARSPFALQHSLVSLATGARLKPQLDAFSSPSPSHIVSVLEAAQAVALAHAKKKLIDEYAALTNLIQQRADDQGMFTLAAIHGGPLKKTKTIRSERSNLNLSQDCKTPEEAALVLETLGTTLRSKSDPFIDASRLPYNKLPPSIRGGVNKFFVDKLHKCLKEAEEKGMTDVISFLPHGRAFKVHKMERFVAELLPQYFLGQNKWQSFSRQANLYGFLKVAEGPDEGAFYHELFLRGHPHLARYMRRVGAPVNGIDRRRFRLPEGEDPDFYAMPPIQAAAT